MGAGGPRGAKLSLLGLQTLNAESSPMFAAAGGCLERKKRESVSAPLAHTVL